MQEEKSGSVAAGTACEDTPCPVNGAEVTCQVYNSVEAAGEAKVEWDRFVAVASDDIFMTYDWCRVWSKYYANGRRARVFVFRVRQRIVAVFPLVLDKLRIGPVTVRICKFMGTDHTPNTVSLLISRGYERLVVERILVLSMAELRWHIFHVGPIAGMYGKCLQRFCSEVDRRKYRVQVRYHGVQTYFSVRQPWNEYLEARGSRTREKWRKEYRRFASRAGSYSYLLADESSFEGCFRGFVDMHQKKWRSEGRRGHFGDWPDSERFHEEFARTAIRNGSLMLGRLMAGGKPVGYNYGYRQRSAYFDYLGATRKDGALSRVNLNLILYGEIIKDCFAKGITLIDSMPGRYRHKELMGGKAMAIKSAVITAQGLRGRARLAAVSTVTRLTEVLYYRIFYRRLQPRIHIPTGGLSDRWIRTHWLSGVVVATK